MFPEEDGLDIFRPIIGSWYESLENPQESQRRVLSDLVKEYEKTRYGKSHHASEIEGVADFRANFPVIDYRGLNPYLAEVKKGDYTAILPEPVSYTQLTLPTNREV